MWFGGFGTTWGHVRSWTNAGGYPVTDPPGTNGSGWVDSQLPHLKLSQDGLSVIAVTSGSNAYYFRISGQTYQAHHFMQDRLTHLDRAPMFTLTDAQGGQTLFDDFSSRTPGAFAGYIDPAGNQTYVAAVDQSGVPTEIRRKPAGVSQPDTESYLYSYDPNTGLLRGVTFRRLSGGVFTTVREVDYAYWDDTQAYGGNAGDLQSVTVKDGSGHVIDTSFYRYYTQPDIDNGEPGYVGGMKYVFAPASYDRLVANLPNGVTPATATDDQVAPYADYFFTYGSDHIDQRVSSELVQGAGCSCSSDGGQGLYQFRYTDSGNAPGYNSWAHETIETLPDGNTNTVFTNAYGEVMLKVFTDTASGLSWDTFYQYDQQQIIPTPQGGRLVLMAGPSAVTGYDPSSPDLMDFQGGVSPFLNSTGLITDYTYYTSTGNVDDNNPGAVQGYLQTISLQHGQGATPIVQSTQDYYLHHAGSNTVSPVADRWVYTGTDQTGAEETTNTYIWFPNSARVQTMTVNKPIVSAAQNGPGTPDVEQRVYDPYGRTTWTRDGGGFIAYTAYDPATGAAIKTITDVDTSKTGDFTGLPAGWMTPTGGGLHLIRNLTVDLLGRPIAVQDPNGHITATAYLDPIHLVATYAGWDTTHHVPTGPTVVTREDRGNGYTETFTANTATHPWDPNTNLPTGAEFLTNTGYAYGYNGAGLQSLARDYTNLAGQLVRSDAYFNLTGLTYATALYIGTANVNYYTSTEDYDDRGRLTRQVTANGTITRTVYDGLGRVTSIWVGTFDTPNGGTSWDDWSPTNNTAPANLVQERSYLYDQNSPNGIGDSNLTQMTEYPGGLAANRVTQYYYDWRDRPVASKEGVVTAGEDSTTHRPIYVTTYDNLDEPLTQQRYDGDQVNVTVNSDGSVSLSQPNRLRAETDSAYDNQGRIYQTSTYNVDLTGHFVGAPLIASTWYNHRDEVVKTSSPGGLVQKMSYDGAGREVALYGTDGNGDGTIVSAWSDAQQVNSTNNVLTQTKAQYDGVGNPTLVTSWDRFDNSTTGGDLTGSSQARASYTATIYDAADRPTDDVNYGTNGGIPITTPPTAPPVRTAGGPQVTHYSYVADMVQTVALTGTVTGGYFTLSYNGAASGQIHPTDLAATVQSDLQAIPALAGNVQVTGPAGGPWAVRFTGALAGTSAALLTADVSHLTGTNPGVALGIGSVAGDAGRLQATTDPRGLTAKADDDLLGRTVRSVQAFNLNPTFGTDWNAVTEQTYDGDNHVLTVTAYPGDGSLQRTQYDYGISNPAGSGLINANDLLAEVQYPDKITGLPSTRAGDQESYLYDNLAEVVTKHDRNQNTSDLQHPMPQTHQYTYDVLGRLTSDSVSVLGDYVDGSVRTLTTGYDGYGNPSIFTSLNATGGVVNQVVQTFNGFGQITADTQYHGDPKNSGTPHGTVAYDYSPVGNGLNASRLVDITYPTSRKIDHNYAAGVDGTISRLTSLSDDSTGTVLESYLYLGLDTVVQRSHPETGINLTYIGNTSDRYTGLDQFDRVVDQNWVNTNTGQSTDQFTYGYDNNGNRLYQNNLMPGEAALGELYHPAGHVDAYTQGNLTDIGYDPLNQETAFLRGQLTADLTNVVGTPVRSQTWSLDALGNWTSLDTNIASQNQTRTQNPQNEIQSFNGQSTTSWYDNNGNTIADGTGKGFVYDAWNRLMTVTGASTAISYAYDSLGRRVQESENGTTRDVYFSSQWQVLEEDVGGVMQDQYVWSPVYVDAMVERDAGGQRLYVQQDANWDTTALVGFNQTSHTWQVVARFLYDPYGQATDIAGNPANSLNPDWSSPGPTVYAWIYLHQGGRSDAYTGLYDFRARDYSPTLGRWMEPDPIEFKSGDPNFYRSVGNKPISLTDPLGLEGWENRVKRTVPPNQLSNPYWWMYYRVNKDQSQPGWLLFAVLGINDLDFEARRIKMGCIGLNGLRLGVDPKKMQLGMPGVRCFCHLNAAMVFQADMVKKAASDEQAVLFAIQSNNPEPSFWKALKPEPHLGCCEYDVSKLNLAMLTPYNFATAIQDNTGKIQYWEWMTGGVSSNPDLNVALTKNLPKYPTTMYCTVTTKKNKYSPPIL